MFLMYPVTAGVAVAVAAVVAARGLPTFCQERTKGADSFGSGWTFVPWWMLGELLEWMVFFWGKLSKYNEYLQIFVVWIEYIFSFYHHFEQMNLFESLAFFWTKTGLVLISLAAVSVFQGFIP